MYFLSIEPNGETKKLPVCKFSRERGLDPTVCLCLHNPVNKLEAMCYWENPVFCGLPLESGKTLFTSVGGFTLPKLHLALPISYFSTLCFHRSEAAGGKLVDSCGKSKNRVQEGWWVVWTILPRAGQPQNVGSGAEG